MINGLSHVSIAVPDLEAAARELSAKYGLKVGAPMVNAQQGVRLAYIELGNGKIELIEPLRPHSPVSKFLERNPKGGIHHLCRGRGRRDSRACFCAKRRPRARRRQAAAQCGGRSDRLHPSR